MKTEWSRSMSYNFLYSRKRLLRQTNYCVKLNSKSNGKKISQIALRELEKHSFCQLHFDQLIARRRCTWVSCKPMIRKVFGSVNMMVKTESTHHKRMSPNLMFAEEGWFWPKLPGTPLRIGYQHIKVVPNINRFQYACIRPTACIRHQHPCGHLKYSSRWKNVFTFIWWLI